MAYYRLGGGKHVGPAVKSCSCERCENDRKEIKRHQADVKKGLPKNEIQPPQLKGHLYRSGDIVESDDNLVARHPYKFDLVDPSGQVVQTVDTGPTTTVAQVHQQQFEVSAADVLRGMNLQQLLEVAREQNVDLSGVDRKKKAEVEQAVRAAVAG